MDSIANKCSSFETTLSFRQNNNRIRSIDVNYIKSHIDILIHNQELKRTEESTNYVILDLDGTILNNWHRQLQILMQVILPKYISIPKSEILSLLNQEQSVYSILPFLKPFCKTAEEYQQIKQIFLDNFLSNNFVDQDILYNGVSSLIDWFLTKNIHLVFLTGRPRSRMLKSTQKYIFDHFPLTQSIPFTLSMKTNEISDFDHKRIYLKKLQADQKSNLVAFIDNESEICAFASEVFPECLIVHFNSSQSNNFRFSGYQLDSWQ
ncbi:MAG: HAD family hydrolase [Promethearchaeota archaeon]